MTSEVSEASKLTTSVGVSEIPEAVVMLLLGKGGLLLSGPGLKKVVAIPIGDSGGQSSIEKDGKLFFLQKMVEGTLKIIR